MGVESGILIENQRDENAGGEDVGGELKPKVANTDELKYLDQIREIFARGTLRADRTGTGTLSIFGMQQRYSLRDSTMPLLTTKKVFWKAIVEELLWFIRGETNSKTLSERGVRIWDANGSRAFLDASGFSDREEGDLGPVYGFQWRHFGAEYEGPFADYAGKGVDQLAELIERIKRDPDSRRLILCAWNVKDVPIMALPPCHTLCQFYVSNGELSCQLYQRSGDMGLGVPFNIASYSLLTHMIAYVCGLKAGEFVHTLGDAHIYTNHKEALEEQLKREPRSFPRIRFEGDIKTIDDFTADSIKLEGYDPHPAIKMQMAV
ncbi:Thymidylate synthase [Aphelenchoides fujianensis]|nr:Thymidylate synthase [Aphelenchoides fujianensis]